MKSGIKTLSLFSGAGGLDIGFHNAGFDVVACVEIDPRFARSLSANCGERRFFGPSTRVHCEDIRNFDVAPYVDAGIECVIGGPPCQTFSAAGRRSGGVVGTGDLRGRLFQRFCEILDLIRPRVFVFENVYGLPGANGGVPWREITEAFRALGYQLRWEVVDAADYGVAQHRERLILVGAKVGEFEFPLPTHGPDSSTCEPLLSVRGAIHDLQDLTEFDHGSLGGLYGHLLPLVPPGLNYAFFTAEMDHPEPVFAWRSKFHDLLYKVDPDAPCRTLKAQPGKFTGPFHWKNRHFTTAELKRLQSFPDEYHLEGSRGTVIAQIGNSVPPRLGYVIGTSIREQLFEQKNVLTFQRRPSGFKSTFRQRQRQRSLHFKETANRANKGRRGAQAADTQIAPFDESYVLVREGQFQFRETQTATNETKDCASTVCVKDLGDRLEIVFKRIVPNSSRGTVTLTGLSKYMGRIDRVDVQAQLAQYGDVFSLWRTIEKCLVDRSRFFSLIDIYGHYANRGDTVRISSEYGFDTVEPLARALSFFGTSETCGAFFSTPTLLAELEVGEKGLDDVVEGMRALRMDVRTSKSHPIIGNGRVLCTYPFPLLSPRALVESRVEFLAEDRLAS